MGEERREEEMKKKIFGSGLFLFLRRQAKIYYKKSEEFQ